MQLYPGWVICAWDYVLDINVGCMRKHRTLKEVGGRGRVNKFEQVHVVENGEGCPNCQCGRDREESQWLTNDNMASGQMGTPCDQKDRRYLP